MAGFGTRRQRPGKIHEHLFLVLTSTLALAQKPSGSFLRFLALNLPLKKPKARSEERLEKKSEI